ncbi:MAG: Ig-like domain-containing protein [Cardiobacteriaceae bacterium]|nr:Ig-like domain-containing protein [Cardiobacteriaceae bacterium]
MGSIADNDTANTPPSAVSDTYEVNEDTPVDLNPLQGDSDPENDTLTVTHINGEALTGGAQTIVVPNGKVEVDASGKLTFVPNANFSGETSFSYTITDGHGNSDTAEQIINVKDVNNSPIVDSVTSPMSLSEEGLPGGLADTLGIVDTTNDRIGNGTLRFTDVDSSNFTLSMTGPASVTSGGETISWTWDSNTLMGSKPDGTLVMTVLMSAPMADGNGAYHADYTVSLLQPIDHPNKGEEDVLALKFGVTVSDNDNNSVVTELVVNVEDDMPTIGADTSVDMTLNKVAIHTNLLVALDLSHSMAAQDNGDPLSRFEHVKNALKAVVDKYDGAGDVAVNLVVFGTNAIPKTNGWVTVAQIKSIIDGLSLYPQGPEGYTNYEAALEKMMEAYANSTGKITKPGTQDISVFLTDGLPSAALGGDGTMQGQIIYGSEGGESNLGIDPAEEAIWKTWLINNKVKSYAYAVGAEVGNDANKAKAHMNPIAYDGKADTDMDGQVSPNAGSLLHAMDKDVDLDAAAIPGNGTVFTGTVNGGFGADAGHVRSVTIGGVTYSYDTVNNQITNDGNTDIINGNQVVIVTPQGGKLTLNMQSGEYTYLPDQSKTQYQENLSFGITDGDGDGKTSNQTWNIVVNPAVGAYDDKLKGTSNSAAIDADMLGWKGEYYGYNDNQIDNRVAENTNFAANARYHADDKSSGNNTISGNNLYTLDFAEKLINGRNGSTVTGSSRSADLGTPDARFNVSKIHYAETTLVDNEKTAPGEQVDNNSGLYRFLEKHGASDGSSIIVEAGVAYNNSAGLGYTTDAAMRFVGNVYFAKGVYDFGLIVDNAAILRIDGKEVVTQGTYSSSRIDSLERYPNGFEITEGVHSVEIIYIEENVNSALHMQYKLHDADDSTYQTLGLDNILMLKPEISLDLNGLQDIQQNGSAWEVRTGSILDGGSGNDVIEGSEARDFVFGGTGNDELSGNGAADTFIFSTQVGNGNDVIKDFTIGEDKIALTQLLEIEGQINPANPDWQGKDSVRNLHWNDADKVLTFTTADGEQNSITFENMTKSYASLDDFLKDNSFIA